MNTDSFLLDSDTYRLIRDGDATVAAHLLAVPFENVWISTITIEEAVSGIFALINRLRSASQPSRLAEAHAFLHLTIVHLNRFQILPYTEADEHLYQSFPAKVKRLGAQDCRLAAQAISHGIVVVTRNRRDFEPTGVKWIDWSLP